MFEYFASGRPIISNAHMGYSLIKKYDCGTELNSNSPEKLANSIIEYKNMKKNIIKSIGNNSRRAAEDYDISLLCKQLEEVLIYALKQKNDTKKEIK